MKEAAKKGATFRVGHDSTKYRDARLCNRRLKQQQGMVASGRIGQNGREVRHCLVLVTFVLLVKKLETAQYMGGTVRIGQDRILSRVGDGNLPPTLNLLSISLTRQST
jgi:hypothetical protein